MIASLIDCHGAATAAAARLEADGFEMTERPLSRFVTASLKVDYLTPTPLGTELEPRGRVAELKARKVIVDITIAARGKTCAQGRVVMVRLSQSYQIQQVSFLHATEGCRMNNFQACKTENEQRSC